MVKHFLDILSFYLQNFGWLSYGVVFLVSFLESLAFVGFFIPGGTFVVFLGFLSAQGFFNPVFLIISAIVGAVLGDGLSYYLGTKGTSFFKNENKLLKLSHLEVGERFFSKHGNKSILLGRFIGPIRPIIPFVAGLAKMKKTKFFFWNVVSAILWGGAYVSLGYFFGASLPFIEHITRKVSLYSVLAVIIVVIVWVLLVRWGEVFKHVASDIKRIILAPVFILSVIIFVILIRFLYNIFFSEEFMYIDNYIQNILVASRSDWGIKFFSLVTSFGGLTVAGLIIAGVSLFLLVYKKYPQVIGFWTALFGGEILVLIGKEFLNKSRPINQVVSVFENSSSFPSGHATLAIILYGFLAFLVYRNIKTIWGKVLLVFSTILFVILIGFSRLYLGVHYFSDVLGGYVLGALWLVMGILITKKIIDLKKKL